VCVSVCIVCVCVVVYRTCLSITPSHPLVCVCVCEREREREREAKMLTVASEAASRLRLVIYSGSAAEPEHDQTPGRFAFHGNQTVISTVTHDNSTMLYHHYIPISWEQQNRGIQTKKDLKCRSVASIQLSAFLSRAANDITH